MITWAYHYDVTKCPDCGADLTAPNGIELTVVVASVPRDGIYTRLKANGDLIDVDSLVTNGYHGGTTCGKCNATLEDYESEIGADR